MTRHEPAERYIAARTAHLRQCVRNSIGLVTALNPHIGYETATAIAREAHPTGRGVMQRVLGADLLIKDELEGLLRPERPANWSPVNVPPVTTALRSPEMLESVKSAWRSQQYMGLILPCTTHDSSPDSDRKAMILRSTTSGADTSRRLRFRKGASS